MGKSKNSRDASQSKVPQPVIEKIAPKEVAEFDKYYNDTIVSARGIMFGKMMTIIDTLNLPGKQLLAVKSLIARDIDSVMFEGLDRNLQGGLLKLFGHQRETGRKVKPLV